MERDYDVIVLGAGLAGLCAAQTIGHAGKRVLVLEARNRAGGRIHTVRDAATEFPIELGPEWVGSDGPLRTLLDSINADVRMTRGAHVVRTKNGLLARENFDETSEIMERIAALLEQVPDVTLNEALARCCPEPEFAESRASLVSYVQGFHTADPARVSARWLLEVEENEPADASEGHALAGLDWAVDALRTQQSESVTLRFNTAVTAVDWSDVGVTLTVREDGVEATITASKLVSTLPLSVLKLTPGETGAVQFTPPLSSKERALSLLDTGPVVKLVLVFDEPFWTRIEGLEKASFIQEPGLPVPTWWTTYPVESGVMTGWVAGPLVSEVAGKHGDALLTVALDSLAKVLGVSLELLRQRLRGWHTHDWIGDPFARGGYSYVLSGGTAAHLELAAPIDNTLFFAGEATCGSGHNATMAGAMQSGYRAAKELLACP